MKTLRAAAVAALSSSLILMGGAPALADDTNPVTRTTGLTDGQPLGRATYFKPVFGDDVLAIRTLVNGKNPYFVDAAKARQPGVQAHLNDVADNTDADVTVEFYTAPGVHTDLTTRVHTDFVAPTGKFSPIGGLVHDTTTITATDLPDDVAAVTLTRFGTEIARATTAPWQLTWDTSGFPINSSVTLHVIDKAGNDTPETHYYTVDNQGPTVEDQPEIYPARRGRLGVYLSDRSGVQRSEWWADGVLVGDLNTEYDWGTKSRTVDATVKAWDVNGHGSTTSFPVVVDADAPVVTSASPANGTLVRGTSVTSTMRFGDVSGVQYATPVSGYSVTDYTSPYVGKFKLGRDGKLTLKWWVADNYNQGGYVYQTVVVDNTRPALAITSAPKNGAKVKGTVKIGAKASDKNGVARVELWVNGKRVATDYRSGYAFSINSAKYGKNLKIQLRAYDRAGNSIATSTRSWRR
ncbi:Ig-like domain-containing protein [Actinoplanes regularis]|uniref:Ig-like domain-containing protein n=1 Tax=Actinoplanes regularis TaxID=52697 RepID=UPI001178AE03|nr:Ig-like domain-containing protein [Actinoplanes regularis]